MSRTRAQKVRHVTAYSRLARLAKLDGRTREATLLRETRERLIQHVGGNPSVTQLALIDGACMLTLRTAQLDAKILDGGGMFTEHDSRTYLAWSNSLRLILRDLGVDAAPAPNTEPSHGLNAIAARVQAERHRGEPIAA